MKRAFTLIEILIAVGLMTILMSVMLARFNNYAKNQKAITAAERIRQVIIEAKTNMVARKIDCSVCGGADKMCNNSPDDTPLDYWQVSFSTPDPASYTILGNCGGVGKDFFIRTESFPGVNLVVTLTGGYIRFLPDLVTNQTATRLIRTRINNLVLKTVNITANGQATIP